MEIWKDIVEWEGMYEVSNKGRVKSLDRYVNAGYGSERIVKGQIIIPNIKNDYETVGLCFDGKRKWYLVHRLVALAFISNMNDYPCVNHIDEIKGNNLVENLEWCTHHYNNTYGDRLIGWGHKVRDKLKKSVSKYTLDGEFIQTYDAMIDATRDGYLQGAISNCCSGRSKSHAGFIWKYEGDDGVE